MNSPENSSETSPAQAAFAARLRRRRDLRRRHERDAGRSFWRAVGHMGTVGWSIALPTAGGVLFGRWLDGRLDSGYVFMIFFMLVGLGSGCTIVWGLLFKP